MDNKKNETARLVLILTVIFCTGIALWVIWTLHKPDYTNSVVVSENQSYVEPPSFNYEPGFYESPFYLELSTASDISIYYTTDGSIPQSTSELYTEPIYIYNRSKEPNQFRSIPNTSLDWYNEKVDMTEVDKAFVVRAVAISENGYRSEIVSASYFVDMDQYKDHSVVSLMADREDLFGDNGIYVTGEAYDEWYAGDKETDPPKANFAIHGLERIANFEIIAEGIECLNQLSGIRVRGHSNRDAKIKQFAVYSRDDYGTDNEFDIELFKNKKTHSISLRPGFENAFLMYLGEGRDVTYQQSFPIDVFLNGEFWYSAYLQEKYNKTFFKETYGVNKLEMFKDSFPQDIMDIIISEDMSDMDAYDRLCEKVDIQSYIDWSCINVYIANCDYSLETNDNCIAWRSAVKGNGPYEDGRLRWCLYDLDRVVDLCRYELGLENITNAQVDSFNVMRDWAPTVHNSLIFSRLKQNPGFCAQYVNTFMDMINTTFAVDNMSYMLETWGEDISFDNYFFANRAEYITGYMEEEFGLKGTKEALTVEVNDPIAGRVRINTIMPDLSEGGWTGLYYTDYPVMVTAIPDNGYRFVGWNGDVSSDEETIMVSLDQNGVCLNAEFERAND